MAIKQHDVLIVGSGHSGGMAAKILTEKGISCLMLNAGPEADLSATAPPNRPTSFPIAASIKPGRLPHVFQANEFNANQWVDEKEIPYTHPPEAPYNWVRVRLLGGRSLFWARQSFRLSDFEFKAADIEGTGDNWPISLADLAPLLLARGRDFPRVGAQGRLAAVSRRQLHRFELPARYRDHQTRYRARQQTRHRRVQDGVLRRAATAWQAPSICCCPMRSRPASSISSRTRLSAKLQWTRIPDWRTARISWIAIRGREMHVKARAWCWRPDASKARACC